jgi:hypothetical protein
MSPIRTAWFLAVAIAAALPLVGQAEARLVSQRVQGVSRLCVYQVGRLKEMGVSVRRVGELRERRIGRGEPCPGRDPGPPRVAVNTAIPPYARLVRDPTPGLQRYCVYEYLGSIYRRPVASGGQCPSTPSFR